MANAATTADVVKAKSDEILGHPKGLFVLFMTEMWERFSYYGMRTLLIFYLTQHFLFADNRSALIYGAYTSLVYLMPVIGGILADRYLGSRKAVTFGAILLVLGHFGMAFEGKQADQTFAVGDASYELITDGRGASAERFIVIGDHKLPAKFGRREWMVIEGGQSVGLGDRIEGSDYKILQERYGFLWLKTRSILEIGDRTYALSLTKSDNGKLGEILVDGREIPFEVVSQRFVTVTGGDNVGVGSEILDFEIHTTRNNFYLQAFYFSLALIIMGVGFLKANISTIVGALYTREDPRRDGGFTIFYMGINLGSFLATLACGALGEFVGWWAGFGLAGIGMLAGLAVFTWGQPLLGGRADPPKPEVLKAPFFLGLNREIIIYACGLAGVLVTWQLVQHQALVGQLLGGTGITMLAVILGYGFFFCEPEDRNRLIVATVLISFSVLFWALFEQAGSSLNLFTDRAVDRFIFGWEVPATWYQSLNALFIFLLAPFFAMMWVALAKKGWEPTTPVKFSLGILLVGVGFLVLGFGMSLAGVTGKTHMIWIVLLYLIHTTGELCLSPVGLSMITKLSVTRVVGMMMGVWFLASAGANFIAGLIAAKTGAETVGGEITDLAAATQTYSDVYTEVAWVAIGVSVVLFALSPLLKRGMHGVH